MGDPDEPDKVIQEVVEQIATEIAIDKRPTVPLERLQMTLELENPEAVASFLEAVAKSIRDKRRIILIVD